MKRGVVLHSLFMQSFGLHLVHRKNPVESDDFRNTHRTPPPPAGLQAYFEPRALLPLFKGDGGSFLVGTISSSPGGIHRFLVLAKGYLLSMVM